MNETNERSVASTGSVQPVAWAVASGSHRVYDIYDNEGEAVAICLWLRDEEDDGSWVTVPLYSKQPQPTLTHAERNDLAIAADAYADNDDDPDCERIAATLRGLLERTK